MSLGLFSTLYLGTRSLQTQQAGVETTGHNLANVNNPAYARQRVQIQTSLTVSSPVGPQGTGAEVIAFQQIRSELLDNQVRNELSVGGYWQNQQTALQNAQARLGQFLGLNSQGATGTSGAAVVGLTQGLADDLTGLFNAFQSVAVSPTSLAERQTLLNQAQLLAGRFNQTAQSLDEFRSVLNLSLDADVASANELLSEIARLNDRIANAENPNGGTANDLRDLREAKLETLAGLVDYQTALGTDGSVNVIIAGTQMIDGKTVLDTLQTYDAGAGQMLVRAATAGTPLALAGGAIQGTIEARDGALAGLRTDLDTLAATLITGINNVHQAGFSLTGSTGAAFFTGTDAATIGVNAVLVADPSLVQAAGVAGAPGNNAVALALAGLADQANAALGNQTFHEAYAGIVADLGRALSSANDQVVDHAAVKELLLRQRDSISGVSIDEEMTNLITFQRAYQASARIITTVDEMLETVLGLKR